ncbi:MAG: CPBP family intramembrane metalloprotease [Treponema sp.]|jgi:membrane protease YdiL (CAAX protease family)|nr:CPBP family intramembrane metalloprotease [Treponema sp.]
MEKKCYPTIKEAVFLCIILFVIQIGTGFIIGLISGLYGFGAGSKIMERGTYFIVILSYALVIYRVYKKSHKKISEILMFNNVSLSIWLSIIIFIPGFTLISQRIYYIIKNLAPMPQFLQLSLQQKTFYIVKERLFISLLLMAIIPSFLFEILFRGIIFNGFRENYSQKKSILISALLYWIVVSEFILYLTFVTGFLFGIISAWICIKTKSLIPGILINLFQNMFEIFLEKFSDITPIARLYMAYTVHPLKLEWFDAIGLVLAAAGIFLMLICIKKYNTAPDAST